jgi:uncharacterized small protein (DUF1192 family)
MDTPLVGSSGYCADEVKKLAGGIEQLKKQLAEEKALHRGERYRLEQRIMNLRKEVKRLLAQKGEKGAGRIPHHLSKRGARQAAFWPQSRSDAGRGRSPQGGTNPKGGTDPKGGTGPGRRK